MGNINVGSRGVGVVGTSGYVGRTKWARAYYDFATDGGAIGAITLRGDKLPSGAVVLSTLVKVDTAVTTAASGTVALGINSTTDVRTAVVPGSGVDISATGVKLGAHTRAAAPLVLSADKDVVATVATGAITAGRFSVLVEYIELAPVV